MPFIPQKQPDETRMDYRHFVQEGVPYRGKTLPLMNSEEYASSTVRRGKSGYGCFDVHNPKQQHFGRTLQQVLDRAATGEFLIHSSTEYNNSGESPKPGPPALYVFVIWFELFDVSTADAYELAKSG